jgi:RNA polymerase sigma-70 factor (ECF subfamily)
MATFHAEPAGTPQNDRSTDDTFVRLLMQHHRLLFVYLRTVLNSTTDAEEVLQETYVVLWRKRHKFLPNSSFVNWAVTIAQYEARNFRRRHKHVPQMLSDKLLVQLASSIVADQDLIDARRTALIQCLDTLNDRDRGLVSAVYSINSTKVDVEQRTGMSPSALRKALLRARQRLLRCIQLRMRREGFA